MRIALGDPNGPDVAERGEEEGIGDAMAAKIRNALTLYRPLTVVENIEIRLHRTVLYNSIYAPMTSSSSISTPTASQQRRHLCSAFAT